MYRVSASIEGISPLLFNKPYTEPARTKTEDARKAIAARERVYRDDTGLYIPKWNAKRLLMDGAMRAGLKIKRTGLAGYLQAGVWFDADPRFNRTDMDFLHEHWGKVPPKRGAMVKIWRPALDNGWLMSFSFQVLDEIIDAAEIRVALATAGLWIGLGSWRPEYGRFIVKDWEVAA